MFCPRVNISPDQLQEKLRIFEASMASIQVMMMMMQYNDDGDDDDDGDGCYC